MTSRMPLLLLLVLGVVGGTTLSIGACSESEPRFSDSAELNARRDVPHEPTGGPIMQTPNLTLTIQLTDNDLGDNQTTTATATVTLDGSPEANKIVTFDISDPSVAMVVPPALGVTGADGKATATVRGVGRGTANVTASINGMTAAAPIAVPSLSTIVLVLLAVVMFLAVSLREHPEHIGR